MIKIEDLEVTIDGNLIIKGLSLEVLPGEIHAIMGPNGAGKSTLAKALAGHPHYEITRGSVCLNGVDLGELSPEERAKEGLFMSFQYPLEVAGITNREFLRLAYCALKGENLDGGAFQEKIAPVLREMQIKESFLDRDLNDGFSGGEKKKNEILQLLVLEPKCAILDETDSGLDIDALRVVGDGVNRFMTKERSLIVITHYQRLLETITPDVVHVMVEGRIVKSGDASLALELEARGYQTC